MLCAEAARKKAERKAEKKAKKAAKKVWCGSSNHAGDPEGVAYCMVPPHNYPNQLHHVHQLLGCHWNVAGILVLKSSS